MNGFQRLCTKEKALDMNYLYEILEKIKLLEQKAGQWLTKAGDEEHKDVCPCGHIFRVKEMCCMW